jgi:pimeloyl-ACP methyl ester carboxylesterase
MLMRLVQNILIGFVGLLVILLVITLIAGAVAKANLKAKYPPPGTLVDVGGYQLHILCEGTGSPTVIMESGLGDSSLIWALVQPEIAKTTRVCVYDRAGLGWSEPSPKPRTAETIVEELHSLLTKAAITGPYVLVGHSIGGVYMRLYAHQYPDDVVGIVLVDSAHEEQMLRAPEAFVKFTKESTEKMARQLEIYKPFAAIGVFALFPSQVPADKLMPKDARVAYQAMAAKDTTFLNAVIAESKAIDESSAQVRAAQIKTLGDIPLVVISRGQFTLPPDAGLSSEAMEQLDTGWQQMQIELASLSSKGKRVVAEQSGHYIHLEQPRLVIDAIKQVIEDAGQ